MHRSLAWDPAHMLRRSVPCRSLARGRPSAGSVTDAAWEWLVQLRTKEANLRVDQLLIWPVLWAWRFLRAFRSPP